MRELLYKPEPQHFKLREILLWASLVLRLTVNQNESWAHFNLGMFYFNAGKYLTAEEAFAHASSDWGELEHEGVVRDAFYMRAVCMYKREAYTQSLAALKFLSYFEPSFRVWIYQALGFQEIGRWDQVELAAREAYAKDFQSTDAKILLATAVMRQRKLIYANMLYGELLAYPQSELLGLYQHWVEILIQLKQHDKARQVIGQMILLGNERALKPDMEIATAFKIVSIRAEEKLQNKALAAAALLIANRLKPKDKDMPKMVYIDF